MNSANLFNLISLLLISAFIILIIVVLINDKNIQAKELSNGKFELKFGYSAYLGIPLQLLGLLIIIPAAINDDSKMAFIFIFVSIIILLNIIINILAIANHRVVFNHESISKKNTFGKISEVKLENISKVKFTFFGYGDDLLIFDNDGNKIKIDGSLHGFNSIVELLVDKKYLNELKKQT